MYVYTMYTVHCTSHNRANFLVSLPNKDLHVSASVMSQQRLDNVALLSLIYRDHSSKLWNSLDKPRTAISQDHVRSKFKWSIRP